MSRLAATGLGRTQESGRICNEGIPISSIWTADFERFDRFRPKSRGGLPSLVPQIPPGLAHLVAWELVAQIWFGPGEEAVFEVLSRPWVILVAFLRSVTEP